VWAIGAYFDHNVGLSQTFAMHWNGSKWKVVPTPNANTDANWLYSVSADAPDDAWTVGDHLNFDGPGADLIEHWDGTAWSIVPGMHPGGAGVYLGATAALSSKLAWAMGNVNDGGSGHLFTERWNGTVWTQVVSETPGDEQHGIAGAVAPSSHLAWMVGIYSNRGDGNQYPLIERYCS
jgi:hypothetical protein